MTPAESDPTRGAASLDIDASARTVWELISDITQMGRWSPENHRSEWLTDRGPGVGSRFRGHNRLGGLEWTSDCEVVEFDPERTFAFRTLSIDIAGGESFDTDDDSSTTWRYEITPRKDSVLLTESFHQEWLADPDSIPNQLGERQQDLIASCEATLAKIKAAAETDTETGIPDNRTGERSDRGNPQ